MKVTEIAFSCYPVTDMDRAKAFYGGVLGLKMTSDHQGANGHWVEYEIGAHTLGLGKMDGFVPAPQGCTVALEVEDFDKAVADLQAIGATIKMGPIETPVCHMLVISDPEDNPLMIHKRKPGHS